MKSTGYKYDVECLYKCLTSLSMSSPSSRLILGAFCNISLNMSSPSSRLILGAFCNISLSMSSPSSRLILGAFCNISLSMSSPSSRLILGAFCNISLSMSSPSSRLILSVLFVNAFGSSETGCQKYSLIIIILSIIIKSQTLFMTNIFKRR